ncbi:O-methyltransferase [Tranquillimonas rosea]|uniref:O-methyltransferase n=1 Tax=Tranquillimonas rosea TaxID=641238 RepID=UPI003BA9C6AF
MAKKFGNILLRRYALKRAIAYGLPRELITPSEFLVSGRYPDVNSSRVSDAAETVRKRIAVSRNEPIGIFYSPKPASPSSSGARQRGAELFFSPERVAQTGKNRRWGSFLFLCAREFEARTVVELGTCAGISAYYIGSAAPVQLLVTVEGSAALTEVARETLKPFGDKVEIHNMLFEDALRDRVSRLSSVDFLFIDGHHEKEATISYFHSVKERLRPGACVIFDDISWSADMRECWEEILGVPGFSCCVDFGTLGVCVWDGSSTQGLAFDLRRISGSKKVGRPHGWEYQEGQLVN